MELKIDIEDRGESEKDHPVPPIVETPIILESVAAESAAVQEASEQETTEQDIIKHEMTNPELIEPKIIRPYVAGRLKEQRESFVKRAYHGMRTVGKKVAVAVVGTATIGLAGFGAFSLYDRAKASGTAYDALIAKESEQTMLIEHQSEQIGRLEDMIRQLDLSVPEVRSVSSARSYSQRNDWKPSADDSNPSYWLSKSSDATDFITKEKDDYVLVVDKKSQTGFLYRLKAKLVDTTPVSTGKNPGDKERAGDTRTPVGTFNVVSVEPSSNWEFEGERAYGPYFLRLDSGNWDSRGNFLPNARSPIGVHGTNEPDKLGLNKSHGCVRLASDKISEYVENGMLKKGTKVVILGDEYNAKPLPVIASADTSSVSLEKLLRKQEPVSQKLGNNPSYEKLAPKKTYHLSGGEVAVPYNIAGVQKSEKKEEGKR